MHSLSTSSALLLSLAALASARSISLNSRTYTSQSGQVGYNGCGTVNSQTSECQTIAVNAVDDFCLWAPPTRETIGNSERYEVGYCLKDGYGTRTMPAGVIKSAHFLVTPHYTQVTGTGDFSSMIDGSDGGGELDPHGADGNGNPVGGIVFSNGEQIAEWTSFISETEYCFRVCHAADDAWLWCQHVYDLQGCEWNEPGNYDSGFETCEGDSTEYPPGIYVENGVTSTYAQGDGSNPAPTAHAAGASSNCVTVATVGGGTNTNMASDKLAGLHATMNSLQELAESLSDAVPTGQPDSVMTRAFLPLLEAEPNSLRVRDFRKTFAEVFGERDAIQPASITRGQFGVAVVLQALANVNLDVANAGTIGRLEEDISALHRVVAELEGAAPADNQEEPPEEEDADGDVAMAINEPVGKKKGRYKEPHDSRIAYKNVTRRCRKFKRGSLEGTAAVIAHLLLTQPQGKPIKATPAGITHHISKKYRYYTSHAAVYACLEDYEGKHFERDAVQKPGIAPMASTKLAIVDATTRTIQDLARSLPDSIPLGEPTSALTEAFRGMVMGVGPNSIRVRKFRKAIKKVFGTSDAIQQTGVTRGQFGFAVVLQALGNVNLTAASELEIGELEVDLLALKRVLAGLEKQMVGQEGAGTAERDEKDVFGQENQVQDPHDMRMEYQNITTKSSKYRSGSMQATAVVIAHLLLSPAHVKPSHTTASVLLYHISRKYKYHTSYKSINFSLQAFEGKCFKRDEIQKAKSPSGHSWSVLPEAKQKFGLLL
ncbi:hypothetical protein MNV49_005380 [Pseudohyphozyma bogoriensis]|nr:hypothetical protein MNV49_005380 [Pseudohyphozyma bogoriensis]